MTALKSVPTDPTTLWLAVGSIIGPIRVRVASELISTLSAAKTATIQSKLDSGYEILETFDCGCNRANERLRIQSAKSCHCEWNIGPIGKCCVYQSADNCLVAYDIFQLFFPTILSHTYHHSWIQSSWYILSIQHIELVENRLDEGVQVMTDVSTEFLKVHFDSEEVECRGDICGFVCFSSQALTSDACLQTSSRYRIKMSSMYGNIRISLR